MKRVVAAFLTASALACAPLTFSNSGAIDFERYKRARVEGNSADYLAGELSESSGFELVTTDPSVEVDLVIFVETSLTEEVECDCGGDCGCDYQCECECTCESEYTATASYQAITPKGHVVDEGAESDWSDSPAEAVEDALDEVALHYFRSYRL